MEQNDKDLVKSLISIIDETISEVEEIRKSKFAASEISLGDSEAGMAGKSKNGELDAKKKEDEDEDKDKEKDEDTKKKDDYEMDKGENEKADEDRGGMKEAPTVSKGENEKADEDRGGFKEAPTVSKKEDKDKDDKDDEDKDKKYDYDMDKTYMKKSLEDSESLIKSYVDEKMSSIEDKLSKMAAAIEAFADAPAGRKGVPSGIAPLHKSTEEFELMSKSEVANKLFELKKSGKEVDSADIFRVETGNQATTAEIANKYGLR